MVGLWQHLGYTAAVIYSYFFVFNQTKQPAFDIYLILFQDNGSITNANSGKITIMVGVAKKKEDPTKKKGELMESNMDAMEVSLN